MRNKRKIIIGIALAVLIFMGIGIYKYLQPRPVVITYNEFHEAIKSDKVDKVYLANDDTLKGVFKDGTIFITDNPRNEGFKEFLLKNDITVDEMQQQAQLQQLGSFVVTLIVFGVVLYFLSKKTSGQMQRGMKKVTDMGAKPETKTSVTFADVAGNDEAKESVKELVDFIKNPETFTKYGARLPRGVIFYGSPGTGKTLMAKAVAGEAGVPFYAVSGSDFVQVYVGVGASRIRDLFKTARENGKCVIFIDEIDALGKKRDAGLDGGSNDERDQTLNALLAEMSGFNANEGIVIIAATNRLDILDEALLRPGRFDRHIEINLPDLKGRFEILKIHSKNKPIAPDVDLYQLAQQTVYFSGAKMENLLNEAAIMAAKRNSGYIEQDDIDKAFYTVIAGAEKKDRSGIAYTDKKVTAYHEAGHALVTKLVAPENIVSRITIIPSTKGAGGFSMNIPPDRMYFRKVDMENDIKIALAGRASEEIMFGEGNITTGASNDIERATQTILNMVLRFGMKEELGILNYDVLYKNGIKQTHSEVIDECKNSMQIYYEQVKKQLTINKLVLIKIAEALLEFETIDEEKLDQIIQDYKVDSEVVA